MTTKKDGEPDALGDDKTPPSLEERLKRLEEIVRARRRFGTEPRISRRYASSRF